ncbi:DUF2169 domain-containing protein [Pusillimonas sp. MFBS29]|uniref:DUF2169 family type VI secretion system accessory protein n=1 Tax=Pusillimonas sp. MFBS29 TaxID=2886690 RepID=UPI001D102428|nr:DUF2169 domain-containing protein [Pusillimonas sp. MFBS29]MCC2596532.1 DUF2169 domain-containing protein [Pusillimonas sp. MFBS29]
MRIIKPLRLGILSRPYQYRRQHQLGVAVLAMTTLDTAPGLVAEADLWKISGEELDEDEVLDLSIPKPCAEFLVSGRAWSHDTGEPGRVAVSARVDHLEKSLIVHGDRHWAQGGMSQAAAVQGVPVNWRHTYGGAGFAENECGMGAARDADGVWRVPNVEALGQRLSREGQAGVPVSLGPVSPARPRRFKRAGGYDEGWLTDGFPGLPDTLDPHFFNAASEDQWFARQTELTAAAEYEIWNMHPEHACLQGRLPAVRARCFVQRHGADDLEEIGMRHTTAWFFPDRERMLLIFHGALPLTTEDGSEIASIMPALESLDAHARSQEHYRQVLKQRLPRDSGALHAFRDKDLLPEQMLDNREFQQAGSGVMGRPQMVNQRQRAATLKQDMLERVRQAGQNPADYQLDDEQFEPLGSLDDLPDYARSMRRKTRLMKVDMLRKKRASEARHKEAFQSMPQAKQAMDTAGGGVASTPGGPPRLNRDEGMMNLRNMAREAEAKGTAGMSIEEFQAMQDNAQAKLGKLYLSAAHHQSPAEPALGGRSVRMRRRVVTLMQGSRDLSGLDLTGVDLSDLDLSQARCHGTWMERANLSRVKLNGADLTRAVLTRAQFHETDCCGAVLDQANLGEALIHASAFDDASFNATILDRTEVSQSRFTRAVFKDCVPSAIEMEDCAFEQAHFDNVTFWQQSRFERLSFDGAVLNRVAWVECGLEAMDYSGASLTACAWVQGVFSSPPRYVQSRLKTCCVVEMDMVAAVFRDALLDECSLRSLVLDKTDFDGARLKNCDFSQASLRDASFVRSDARGTLFMETDMAGADLREADLIDALMQKSDFRFADLRGANLFRADVSQSLIESSTRTAGAYVKFAKTLPKAQQAGGGA